VYLLASATSNFIDIFILDIPWLLLAGCDGVGQQELEVLRPDEPRVAIFLEQQVVDVLGRNLEGEPAGRVHGLLGGLHGLAVDVDLRFGARL